MMSGKGIESDVNISSASNDTISTKAISYERRSTSPANSQPRSEFQGLKYVYDLPYNVRKSLCDLMDADGSWRQLGGQCFGLDETKLILISHAFLRGASPTNDLLIKWEQLNPKIEQLFLYFHQMKHLRAMILLKPFVDPDLFQSKFKDSSMNSKPLFVKLSPETKSSELNQDSGAVGGQLLPSYSSRNNYELNMSRHESKVSNIEHSNNWNNFSDKCSTAQTDYAEGDDRNVYQPPSNDHIQSTLTTCTRSSMLSNVEEDLEIMYKELMIATDDFSEDNIIGSGGFGIVYKGEWKGTQVAIKRMKSTVSNSNGGNLKMSNQSNNSHVSQAITELRILNRYRIDNILPLYGISLDGPEACIVYQYMSNGSLEDRLLCKIITPGRRYEDSQTTSADHSTQQVLTWTQRASIGEGIARALNYLHTLKGKPLVHGDVKSANVLLDAQFEPKLGDFGLSRQVNGDNGTIGGMYTHVTVTSVHGTSVYLPPEYLRQKILSPAVDAYSYGVVMLEMATGKRAFDGKKLLIDLIEDEMKFGQCDTTREGAIKLRDPKLPEGSEGQSWFHSLIKLGTDCGHKSKRKRPDMSQVLDFYATCKTRDRIRRLSLESVVNRVGTSSPTNQIDTPLMEGVIAAKELFRQRSGSGAGCAKDGPSLPLPPDNADIKTPLELQLWYDMVRMETNRSNEGQSTICPTIGSSTEDQESRNFSHSSFYSDQSSNDFVDVVQIPVPSNEKVSGSSCVDDLSKQSETSSDEPNSIIPLITELGINK